MGTSLDEIWNKIKLFSFTKMCLKMSSGKWPFCLCLNVLMNCYWKGTTEGTSWTGVLVGMHCSRCIFVRSIQNIRLSPLWNINVNLNSSETFSNADPFSTNCYWFTRLSQVFETLLRCHHRTCSKSDSHSIPVYRSHTNIYFDTHISAESEHMGHELCRMIDIMLAVFWFQRPYLQKYLPNLSNES